jgi:pimeloyl-ACP methyl ester carboxylesterase
MVVPGSVRRRHTLLPVVTAALAVLATVVAGCSPAGTDSAAPAHPGTAAPAAPAGAGTAAKADPASDPALAEFYGQKPSWHACGSGFQCAMVTVPMDWTRPEGKTLQLAVTRQPATGTRIGSLLFNPGGPGVSGVSYIQAAVGELPKSIRRAYDIVSWDTRGVGGSKPAVVCLPNDKLDAFYAEDATPDTVAEEQALVETTKQYVAACQAHTGELLKYLDTLSTVRDMDVLRAVLGEQVLSYVGASYGTYLGAWYAQTFPWRVGRLVLDGAIDPSLDGAQYAQAQARGFARAVQGFVDDCLAKSGCPLRGSRQDALAQLDRLSMQIDAKPLRTDGRPLTQALFLTGLLAGMYSEEYWPLVSEGLTEAMTGDGSTMLLLADSYLDRDPNGRYGQLLQVYTPISCLDHGERRTLAQLAAEAARLKRAYPPFGDVMAWGQVGCELWPYPAVMPERAVSAPGAAPILVVGTTNDPATPYEEAQALASQLSSGRLLTYVGDGHTAYLRGSRCIDDAVNAYLLTGSVPPEGTRCQPG